MFLKIWWRLFKFLLFQCPAFGMGLYLMYQVYPVVHPTVEFFQQAQTLQLPLIGYEQSK